MNKQEVINQLKESLSKMIENIEDENDFNKGYRYATQHCFDIIKQLDEPVKPEKPVVPQFMDYWIQGAKYNGFDLYEAMTDDEMPDKVATWIVCNPETFAKAWIYGYEVEKEKLYIVELPNPNAGGHVVLCKTRDGIVSITFAGTDRWRGGKNVQLTEAEIKKDFEWAWQFAKEVEE